MATYRVLVSDPISEKGVEALRTAPGISVDVNTGLKPEELLKIIGDYHGLVVRSQTKVTAEVFAAATNLKAIGRAGVGVDNIDRAAATDHGVVVMNTPSGNTISTAEHAFSLMLSLARNIPQAHATVIAGKWDRKSFEGKEVFGKRLAILGMGRIGSEFAKRAQAFGITVVAYDPFLTADRAKSLKVEHAETPEAALTGADLVTLHVPLTPETQHIINSDRIALLNKGALVVNCARGGLVDEAAAKAALDSGHLGGIALDVYEVEPPPADFPLFSSNKAVFTPHLGASTAEAQENVGIEVAHQVKDFLVTGEIRNAVNMPNLDSKTIEEVGPYLDLAQSLGKLLYKIGPAQSDSIKVSYVGPVSEIDTELVKRSVLSGYLSAAHHEAQVNLINAPAIAKAHGIQVTESTAALASTFTDLIEVSVSKGGETTTVAGTLVGKSARIVHIAGHYVETNPAGRFLFVENDDRPGIVGVIGSALGAASVNIANMSLSRNRDKNTAVTVIEVDTEPPATMLESLRATPGILRVLSFEL
ncbi:phosphoglycerate dehydrogenase [Luteolibacter sp. SL250]|uniref:phosphoglycerate dehydrogenase n=1 Tax=Luteolibacter sp. SL250 TaxID=2995170 RepID=UPI0022721722|nr:phosphoglycerate dehydrogenase [Luteolibacter sp. SL250]MBX3739831.1 phosphoglycerate dehydrogenase [Akkermansiaceae bacterium]WAC17778.1 phosphoglycerate dehydrogenase [Luteolibacter sp. SL250]